MTDQLTGTVVGDWVARWAAEKPGAAALVCGDERVGWASYLRRADTLARILLASGLERGGRLAVWLPDGPEPHLALLATERAGMVAVGIGYRAGLREAAHLLGRSGASAVLLAAGAHPAALSAAEGPDGLGVPVVEVDFSGLDERDAPGAPGSASAGDTEPVPLGAEDVFMLNSTSGTTGLPKLVVHTERRWMYFHTLAEEAGGLTGDDVFFSALPAPFGFGLWTRHFTPAVLGVPLVTTARFEPAAVLAALEAERVTVLAAVTTQLIMLLSHPDFARTDLSALRVVFTGGEAVPYEKAAEFEERTGATVLQFYGSNETGAASVTTLTDDRPHRLTTAGRIIPGMQVRLYDPQSGERIEVPGRGQPACLGPATCEGYWDDAAANAELYTADGWMLMGDLVEIDADGYLSVVGRTSDIIIRGGKNISAPAVEAELMTHPAVALAAVVAVPDPVFGERVGVFVEMREGEEPVGLDALVAHLAGRGVTREWFPEHLLGVGPLPRSSGGKVAKGELREEVRRRTVPPPLR